MGHFMILITECCTRNVFFTRESWRFNSIECLFVSGRQCQTIIWPICKYVLIKSYFLRKKKKKKKSVNFISLVPLSQQMFDDKLLFKYGALLFGGSLNSFQTDILWDKKNYKLNSNNIYIYIYIYCTFQVRQEKYYFLKLVTLIRQFYLYKFLVKSFLKIQ